VKQLGEEKDRSQLKGEKRRKSLFEEETWRRGVQREKRI
jgi:hypothetical protein